LKNTRVYVCEDSIDGIFTGIYQGWASKYGHEHIRMVEEENLGDIELFCDYIIVKSDRDMVMKVARSIKEKISAEAYALVCRSAMSGTVGRADAIYRFLLLGFSMGGAVTENFSHPLVYPLFKMDRNVNNEVHHYLGFLRFSQLKNTVLFARISPVNNIITLIADHFAERLADENWLIYDVNKQTAVIHKRASQWIFTDARDLNLSIIEDYSDEEEKIQLLWQKFVDTIPIESRLNKKLQSQLLPNRYRAFMREVPYKDNW
jgi:probable DNA metabolism protein